MTTAASVQQTPPGKLELVRTRSLREVLRDTTTILRQHFSTVLDPFFIAGGIGGVLTWAAVRSGNHVLIVVSGIVGVLLISFASAAAKIQLGEIAAGRRPRLGNALKAVTSKFFPTLLGTTLLAWAAIGAGSMFIVPALILWLRLMYTQQLIVLEGAGARAALEGSNALARGHSVRGLAVLAYAFAPQIVSVVLFVVLMFMGVRVQPGPLANVLYSVWAGLLFLTQPVLAVATTLLYFDLRVRNASPHTVPSAGTNTSDAGRIP